MPNRTDVLILSAALCLAPFAARPQQNAATARDMFHSAAGLLVPVKATERPKAARPASKAAESKRPATAAPAQASAVAGGSERPAAPLGLRYSILKQTAGSQTVEVDTDSVFRSGDRIRLLVQANDDAYLYIVQRGSSGNWSLLFPTPEIAGGNNRIEKGRSYEIPAGHWFAFDEQPGEEKLFIVLSRPPEASLEKMIYALQQGGEKAPAVTPPEEKPAKTLLAANVRPIDDDVVSRIRGQVAARDLVFEKVDENSTGAKKEKAVYVVNRSGSADSRVVADVTLQHK